MLSMSTRILSSIIMKTLATLMFLFISFVLFGQEIKENYIDEFTGQSKVSTSWKTLYMGFSSTTYQRLYKQDDQTYLNIKMSKGPQSVFAVAEDAMLLLKLLSDTILTLRNLEYTITSTGGGAYNILGSKAQGLSLYFPISKKYLEILSFMLVKKIRIYTTKGYFDQKINSTNAEKLKKACVLILNLPAPEKKSTDF